ncbi:hypothetical protein XU18_1178 [Perkinsela sp. CCAP 1560/4]|nr:hypothetical protein XU18_1178 [Perkinsela sp. CCAP 1560/4]|eukprot:KNH08277.1 hypothetical protein XU18_1178 [Perkinsela sp. CCAP 1560/4]
MYVPRFGRNRRRKETELEMKSLRNESNLSREETEIAEEKAWERVHSIYKFILKPAHLSWADFLQEQARYEIRWKLLSTKSQVMSLSINQNVLTAMEAEKDGNVNLGSAEADYAPKLHVLCDCTQHHTMNDLLAALCHHWHSGNASSSSAVRVMDDRGQTSEMILSTENGRSSLFYLGGSNLATAATSDKDKFSIIPSISLATMTRLVLESVVLLLKDSSFGFPNYKLCKKSHMNDVKSMWGTLRAAACLLEEPLPIAEDQLGSSV